MKTYFYFLVFSVLSFLFFGCKEDPVLSVSVTAYNIENDGGTINVNVTTNQTLEVLVPASAETWIKSSFDPQTAVPIDGVVQIPFSFIKSDEYESRSADVTISGGGLTCLLSFTQQGCKILQVEESDIFIPHMGKSISLAVLHNMEYEIQISDKTWIGQTGSRGVQEDKLSFDIMRNETYDYRYGYIVLKDKKSNFEQKINITQGSTPFLSVDKDSIDFNVDGGVLSLEITANIPYSIDILNDWIDEIPSTRGLTAETHSFEIQALQTEEISKVGYINVINDSLDIKRTIVIFQKFEQEKIDLGLPSGTKWASTNLGTCKPFGLGQFFAWGEIVSKDSYSEDNYIYGNFVTYNSLLENNIIDTNGDLKSKYDATTSILGKDWHTPTISQIQELQNPSYTTIKSDELDGVKGVRITSKKNGKSIFLPYAGYSHNLEEAYKSLGGFYWSSTYSSNRINRASYMVFGDVSGYWSNIFTGYKIRPVSK